MEEKQVVSVYLIFFPRNSDLLYLSPEAAFTVKINNGTARDIREIAAMTTVGFFPRATWEMHCQI